MNFMDPKVRKTLEDLADLLAEHPTQASIRLAICNAYQLGLCDGKIAVMREKEPA